jgi:hypothetical protein
MVILNISRRLPALPPLPGRLVEIGYGFVYWLLFLLVLEPDNALRAQQAGHPLAVGQEVLRIVVAALLGATSTPALLALTRRFPLFGPGRLRHALVHSVGTTALAFGLIVASCFLAAWGYERRWLPSLTEIHSELVGNWLLLIYALFALTGIAHLVRRSTKSVGYAAPLPEPAYVARVPVKTRGRQGFVAMEDVDWIETQGNYLALHVGSGVHMIREASIAFEARLDPRRFVRIHRRAIVAIDRIRDLQPVTNGDATLRLADGQELRASRRYRKVLAVRWSGPGTTRSPL